MHLGFTLKPLHPTQNINFPVVVSENERKKMYSMENWLDGVQFGNYGNLLSLFFEKVKVTFLLKKLLNSKIRLISC